MVLNMMEKTFNIFKFKNITVRNFLIFLATLFFSLGFLVFGIPSGIAGFNVTDILFIISCILFAVVLFFDKNFKFSFKDKTLTYIYFILSLFVLSIIAVSVSGIFTIALFTRFVRWSFFGITLYLATKLIDLNFFKKFVVYLSVVASLFLIFQLLFDALFNVVLSFNFGGRVIGYAEEILSLGAGQTHVVKRFSSFFTEPSYFSFFTALGLYLVLNYEKRPQYMWPFSIVISVAVVLTTSTYGIALIALIWLFYSYYFLRRFIANKYYIVLIYVIGVIFGLLILLIFKETVMVTYLLNKLKSIGLSSRTLPITYFANKIPWFHQIYGIGLGNEEIYFRTMTFFSSLNLTFLGGGYCGIGLLILYFVDLFIREKKNHLLKIIFIFIVLFSSSLYAAISTVYLVMIYNLEEPIRKIKINEKEIILENELE